MIFIDPLSGLDPRSSRSGPDLIKYFQHRFTLEFARQKIISGILDQIFLRNRFERKSMLKIFYRFGSWCPIYCFFTVSHIKPIQIFHPINVHFSLAWLDRTMIISVCSGQKVHRGVLRVRGLPHPGHLWGAPGWTRRQSSESLWKARALGRRTRHVTQALAQGQVSFPTMTFDTFCIKSW